VDKYAHLATIDEIKANDYNLNVPLYVDTFEEEAPVDLVAVKADIARIDGELTKARAELSAALKELGL
jgi:type I restriction enzyme M protein